MGISTELRRLPEPYPRQPGGTPEEGWDDCAPGPIQDLRDEASGTRTAPIADFGRC